MHALGTWLHTLMQIPSFLCINDRLNAISKTYEGTVGSLWEANESGLFCFCSVLTLSSFHRENRIDLYYM